MDSKIAIIGLLSVMVLVSLSPAVHAIGVKGKAVKIYSDFIPGTTEEYEFKLVTTSQFTQDYEFYTKGEFADIISFDPPERLSNVYPGDSPRFKIILTYPQQLDRPGGIYELRAGVIETVASSGGTFGAKTAVEVPIFVRVLYPGKYLKASLDAPDVNIGQFVNMKLRLENWGKEDLEKVDAVVNVYDPNNRTMATIYSSNGKIPSRESKDAQITVDTTGYSPGEYTVVADIDYDGKKLEISDIFKVGSLNLELVDYTQEFLKGRINPFDITVKSGWNSPMDDVYAVVSINGKELQTPTTVINPWSTKVLRTYWDNNNTEVREYDGTITLHFSGESEEHPIKVMVVKEMRVEQPLTIEQISIGALVVIVAALIIAIAALQLRGRRRKRKK